MSAAEALFCWRSPFDASSTQHVRLGTHLHAWLLTLLLSPFLLVFRISECLLERKSFC